MESGPRRLLAVLAPPRCAVCARPCRAVEPLCAGCAAALAGASGGVERLAGFGTVCWAAPYEGIPRRLVSALKFGGRTALAAVAAEAIAAALRAWAPEAVDAGAAGDLLIVAVPPAARRAHRRGFDPAELIAIALGRALGIRVGSPLGRTDHGRQVGRPRATRLAEPPRVRAIGSVPGRALLVDDVATTGATLAACASALRGAGADSVAAAVFARAP